MALGLVACAPAVQPPPEPAQALVWPAAPAEPRIVFVRSFSRPEDLGIRKTMLQRMAEFVFGERDVQMVRPTAVVASGGLLYVADAGALGVHRFDTKNGGYRLLRAEGDVALPSPVGLAVGPGGEVYVTDSALARVFVIRPGADEAALLGIAGLRQPTGIAYDRTQGRLYVTDTAAHSIVAFDAKGNAVSRIGLRGAGDGQFNYPTLIWCDAAGRLYVTDSLNFRVQVFDPTGRFVAKWGRHGDGTGDAARQKGVATDRHGHVYVVDALFHAFQIFDARGEFLLSVGAMGRDRGEFWLPMGIFVGDDDVIYVADAYNRRVQMFRYLGGKT
jgi:DNA-binding beta-propeller fold protein YncE